MIDNSHIDRILEFIKENPLSSSKKIFDELQMEIGYATVKRNLAKLLEQGKIKVVGQGKASKYLFDYENFLFTPVNLDTYFEHDVDERKVQENYNFSVIDALSNVSLFNELEINHLKELNDQFSKNISELSSSLYRKEMERLAIDLSWKSSQIEGNTYTLLETERLLKEKRTASGKTKDEATMLLNHKDALDFLLDNQDYILPISISKIEDIHSILIKELDVERNLRTRRVGITGTNYRPLDNEFQIQDEMIRLCDLINYKENVFEKSLTALLMISYIQPFNDGNKRTARIVSNAVLMANQCCPISFRTVDSVDYKKAMLLFYEQNNISAFKKIFVEQFEWAVKSYF